MYDVVVQTARSRISSPDEFLFILPDDDRILREISVTVTAIEFFDLCFVAPVEHRPRTSLCCAAASIVLYVPQISSTFDVRYSMNIENSNADKPRYITECTQASVVPDDSRVYVSPLI